MIYKCKSVTYKCKSVIYKCKSMIYKCISVIYKCKIWFTSVKVWKFKWTTLQKFFLKFREISAWLKFNHGGGGYDWIYVIKIIPPLGMIEFLFLATFWKWKKITLAGYALKKVWMPIIPGVSGMNGNHALGRLKNSCPWAYGPLAWIFCSLPRGWFPFPRPRVW